MQFGLLIYESPEAFAARSHEQADGYTGAWRARYRALLEGGVVAAGDPLEVLVTVKVEVRPVSPEVRRRCK